MTWDSFIYFAIPAVLLWTTGAWAAWKGKTTVAYATTVSGLLVFFAFISHRVGNAETKIGVLAGLIVFFRWKYKWILSFSTLLSVVFICVNLFKPEIHSKTLMPALQSPWFAPHVIVYMFAYAVLGAAMVMALYLLFFKKKAASGEEYEITDNLVYVGLAFMTFGMLFGALWAKEAWGHYWSWDPKETWAAITWFAYLIYVHYRQLPTHRPRLALWILLLAFILLQMCWWGINYLPSAQGSSVHVYN